MVHTHSHDPQPGSGSAASKKDPVCGMGIDPATAKGPVLHQGTPYYFCSQGCQAKFAANPGAFAGALAAPVTPPGAAAPGVAWYVCPMHPEIRQSHPGACPTCGMALEPEIPAAPAALEFVCPMHPEVVQDHPGSCPTCGMALEPRTAALDEAPNAELLDMTHRFWVSAALTLPVFLLAMTDLLPAQALPAWIHGPALIWIQLLLASPVVLWGGWPFFTRGWASVRNRALNMFTLIAMGTGVAYGYSLFAALLPEALPQSFRGHGGTVPVYSRPRP